MRAVFLTHYFPPERGAAPARIAALAHGLVQRGVDVTVHTGFPHYPSGKITQGYRNRPLAIEHDGDVRIVRSLVYPTPNRGFARRLADHGVFAASALASAWASGPADVVIAESPPLFTAAAGVGYAIAKRAPLALNISDLWPESAVELGALPADGRATAAARALALFCYRHAALIAAPTAGIVEALRATTTGVGPGPGAGAWAGAGAGTGAQAGITKIVQIPPAVDLERFAAIPPLTAEADMGAKHWHGDEPDRDDPDLYEPDRGEPNCDAPHRDEPRPDRPLRVLYAGVLGMAQGLASVVEAAALAGPGIVELTIAGEGAEAASLQELITVRRIENVHMLGGVAPTEIPALYGSADAGIVPLRDLAIFRGALPTKLFEVLAAGRPAIVAAHGEAADLVREARAGIAVAPESPRALAEAFTHLQGSPAEARDMGVRAREHARRYARQAVVDQWHELIAELTAAWS